MTQSLTIWKRINRYRKWLKFENKRRIFFRVIFLKPVSYRNKIFDLKIFRFTSIVEIIVLSFVLFHKFYIIPIDKILNIIANMIWIFCIARESSIFYNWYNKCGAYVLKLICCNTYCNKLLRIATIHSEFFISWLRECVIHVFSRESIVLF